MDKPTLIFCNGGNKRLAEIAKDAGFILGAQLPATVYHPVYFADQDYSAYQNAESTGDSEKCQRLRNNYMEALAKHRPYMASVYDWMRLDQLGEVLGWAEEAAQYVDVVMLIPKVQRGIPLLPRVIGGKPVRLGYSIPTTHGGTPLPYSDFRGWPVHLLGGNPHKQMKLTRYMNVVSADGNMAGKMAHRCRFWRIEKGEHGHWVNMYETGDIGWGKDANYEAFRRSCVNIMSAWDALTG